MTLHVVAAQKHSTSVLLVQELRRLLHAVKPGDTLLVVAPAAYPLGDVLEQTHLEFDLESCPVCGGAVKLTFIIADTVYEHI